MVLRFFVNTAMDKGWFNKPTINEIAGKIGILPSSFQGSPHNMTGTRLRWRSYGNLENPEISLMIDSNLEWTDITLNILWWKWKTCWLSWYCFLFHCKLNNLKKKDFLKIKYWESCHPIYMLLNSRSMDYHTATYFSYLMTSPSFKSHLTLTCVCECRNTIPRHFSKAS